MNTVKELKTIIRQVHEDQAAAGCDLHATETARIVERQHPALVDDYTVILKAKGLAKMCADDIRALQGVTQETIEGLGLELPMVVTVSDGEGGFAHRPIHRATLADFDNDVSIKGENVRAAQSKYDAARRASRVLHSAPGASDATLVMDAVRSLQIGDAA